MTVERGIIYGGVDGCCGLTQVYAFSEEPGNSFQRWEYDTIQSGDSEEEVYQALFDAMRAHPPFIKLQQIWFVKNKLFDDTFEDVFVAEPFRKLIASIPNVLDLGEFVNPNSGNIIHGYQWEHE